MKYPVTLIRGKGRGLEITTATQVAIAATGVEIDWQIVDADIDVMDPYDPSLPTAVLDSIRQTKTALKGPMARPAEPSDWSIDREICKQLHLYANLHLAKSMVGVQSCFPEMDLVIVRENTEDLYTGIEFERTTIDAAEARSFLSKLSSKRIREDSAIGIKAISVKGCGQIIEFAFNYAQTHGRQKITVVHNANVMQFTDGLFLDIAREVAKEFPDIEFADQVVGEVCMQLTQQPQDYDVLVMPNLYGEILSNLCTGMIGGWRVAPSAYMGDEYAVFSATHPSNPPFMGSANPTALILSGVLMLHHLGEQEAAQKLQIAVGTVIAAQTHVTADLAPVGTEPVGTEEMAQAIAQAIV